MRTQSGGWAADVGIFLTILLSDSTQVAGLDEGGGGGRERLPQVRHHLHEGRALGVEDTLGLQTSLELTVSSVLHLRLRDGTEDEDELEKVEMDDPPVGHNPLDLTTHLHHAIRLPAEE